MAVRVAASVPPTTPRPASSLILLRRGGRHADRGVEVLMVRRSDEARFMPGVWVFPGGTLDAAAADRVVEPVLPRVVGEGDDRRVVLPGEPGYERRDT